MVKNVEGLDVPGTPGKFGHWNSIGTPDPLPVVGQSRTELIAEFVPAKVT